MKNKFKGIYKFLILIGFILLFAMVLSIPTVANTVGSWTGIAGDKIKSVARLIVATGVGVALISWGVAAIAIPVLAIPMILIGLAIVAYQLWPLFSSPTITKQ